MTLRIVGAREGLAVSFRVAPGIFADYAGSAKFLPCLASKFSNCRFTRHGLCADIP